MNIASYSSSASDWLELMEPGIAAGSSDNAKPSGYAGVGGEIVLFRLDGRDIPDNPFVGQPMDLVILPGEFESAHQYREVSPEAATVLTWNPKTLKSALDYALRLARLVDRLPVFMQILAKRERDLRQLGSAVAAEQARSGKTPPSALCLYFDVMWRVFGNWAPDIVERAGGRYALLESGDSDIVAREEDLVGVVPDVIFVCTERDGVEDTGAGAPEARCVSTSTVITTANEESNWRTDEVARSGLNALVHSNRILPAAYLLPTHILFSSGPSLHSLIFQMAGALHPGCSAVPDEGRKLVLLDSITEYNQ